MIKITHKITQQLNRANRDLLNAQDDFHRDGLGTDCAGYFVLRFNGKGNITNVQFDAGTAYLTIEPTPMFNEIYVPGPIHYSCRGNSGFGVVNKHFPSKNKWEEFLGEVLPYPLVLGRVVKWPNTICGWRRG